MWRFLLATSVIAEPEISTRRDSGSTMIHNAHLRNSIPGSIIDMSNFMVGQPREDVRFLQKRDGDSEPSDKCGGIELEQNDLCRDTVLWAAGGGKWRSCKWKIMEMH